MSYQLTADQWRIVLLIWFNHRGRLLAMEDAVRELTLTGADVADHVDVLHNLKVIHRDVAQQLDRGQNWPSYQVLELVFVWEEAAKTPTKGRTEARLLAELLHRRCKDQGRYRSRRLQGYFKLTVREAVMFARRSIKKGRDPHQDLQAEIDKPALGEDGVVRRAAYIEVLEYWKIRPPMPTK